MSVVIECGGDDGGKEYLGAWTIKQVCKHLSVSRATCYRMVEAGHLEKVTVGRRGARITVASVMKFLSKPKQ